MWAFSVVKGIDLPFTAVALSWASYEPARRRGGV
jgi:hypothetical protein